MDAGSRAAAGGSVPMTGPQSGRPSAQWFRRYGTAVPANVDLSRPSPARVYDRLLGGKDNFAVDRAVAEQMTKAVPQVAEGARLIRACLKRVIRYMAIEAGIDQFIDLGSGLPTQENVHEIAQRYAPGAKVVYVDNDPVVTAHARAILTSSDSTGAATADLCDVDGVLGHPEVARLIDLDRPVGLIMCAVIHYVPDGDDPKRIIGAYRDRLASGGHLFLSSICRFEEILSPAGVEMERIFRESLGAKMRTVPEIAEFFAGWELIEPGLLPLALWRPDPLPGNGVHLFPERGQDDIPESYRALVGGVARKETARPAPTETA